jgi:3-hydroxymyristoyl/3-hydroxydecanoyl-(acyl carrier protein) dehydratase
MAYLVKLNDFVFEGDVRAGDRLLLTARLRRRLGKLVLFKAEASVQGRRICAGEMTFLVKGEG